MTEKKNRSPKEIKHDIKILRKAKRQDEKYLEIRNRELESMQALHEFELQHKELDGDKPAYHKMQEYHDMVLAHKEILLRYKEIELKDSIDQLMDRIEGAEKIIVEMERGITEGVKDE